MKSVYFEFSQLDNSVVQSPEDKIDRLNARVLSVMSKCRNLDYFYDVVFELADGHLIKANSLVLYTRSAYFKPMFNSKYGF